MAHYTNPNLLLLLVFTDAYAYACLLSYGPVISIGVGAQSTLGGGQDIFARKYMHEKLTKFPNFT